jgi:tetratricopeptide (TPR) repeat protein
MIEHYDRETIAAILATDDAAERDALSDHGRKCDPCSESFARTERAILDATDAAKRRGAERLRRAAEEFEAARRRSTDAVERLASLRGRALDEAISRLPVEVEVVRSLAEASTAVQERDSARALRLAEAATSIGSRLSTDDADALFATALGKAWKQLAHARRYRSDYEGALNALDHAEDAFRLSPATGLDLASVDFVRATVLIQSGRVNEARPLLDGAAQTFVEFGDEQRLDDVRFLAGVAAYRLRDLAAAQSAFEQILPRATGFSLAGLHNNLGHCAVELGDMGAAAEHFSAAAAAFTDLRMPLEAARSEWGRGRALLAQGKFTDSIPFLDSARSTFESSGMIEESGLAALDRVRALCATGRRAEAQRSCEQIRELFESAGLDRRVTEAVALLGDAFDAPGRPEVLVPQVAAFIQLLKEEPTAEFLPQ